MARLDWNKARRPIDTEAAFPSAKAFKRTHAEFFRRFTVRCPNCARAKCVRLQPSTVAKKRYRCSFCGTGGIAAN